MKQYTRVRARVNLDAVEANIDSMKRNLKDGVKMIVVIKADGYGHRSEERRVGKECGDMRSLPLTRRWC